MSGDTIDEYEEGAWEARLSQDGVEYRCLRSARYIMSRGMFVVLTAAFDVPEVTGIVSGFPFEPEGPVAQATTGGEVTIAYQRKT
jgi:hypothetical protein